MKTDIPRLVIAAPASGSGKSTIATGLMAALAASHTVQGFKVGPDYIDPGYHTAATGRPSRNLDTWMVPPAQVLASFGRAAAGTDIAIVEGVMGLFDGYHAKGEEGSSAQLAKLLRAPVVLVLDVRKMARSAGAMALGYRLFDPQLEVAGVICNNVGSPRHARWVSEAVESVGLPVLGCLPRSPELHIPERHLGLYTAVERRAEVQAFLAGAAELVARHIDLEQVWAIARRAPALDLAPAAQHLFPESGPGSAAGQVNPPAARLAVAQDEAFCFYYEDNFDILRAAGAELVFFSPLRARSLPAGISGLYLGGGYPELYAARLADNIALQADIRAAHAGGLPIYAECGGLMFLTGSLADLSDKVYPMVGVLPGGSRMRQRLVMGYRQLVARRDSLLLKRGDQVRGHEFHYSDWWDGPAELPAAYDVVTDEGEPSRTEGFAGGNLLASYIHLHFAARPAMASRWVQTCLDWQEGRRSL